MEKEGQGRSNNSLTSYRRPSNERPLHTFSTPFVMALLRSRKRQHLPEETYHSTVISAGKGEFPAEKSSWAIENTLTSLEEKLVFGCYYVLVAVLLEREYGKQVLR